MSGIIWRNLGFDNPGLFFQSRINPRLILDQKRVADLNLPLGLFNLRLILDYFFLVLCHLFLFYLPVALTINRKLT